MKKITKCRVCGRKLRARESIRLRVGKSCARKLPGFRNAKRLERQGQRIFKGMRRKRKYLATYMDDIEFTGPVGVIVTNQNGDQAQFILPFDKK
jgi:hypothetical protein